MQAVLTADSTRDPIARASSAVVGAPRLEGPRPWVSVRRGSQMRRLLSFRAANYLGYGTHPEVTDAAKDALDRFGLGAAGPPSNGPMVPHETLMDRVAAMFGGGSSRASLFGSGYGANLGTIGALCGPGHTVVHDRRAHASIVEGARLSGAQIRTFAGEADLDRVLATIDGRAALVCFEGIDGDRGERARLDVLVPVAKRHGARVLVDESHAMLVSGPEGRGEAARQGVIEQVDLITTTFGKACAGVGGALIAEASVVDHVDQYARCRASSCALSPPVVAGIVRAIGLGRGLDGSARRTRLHASAARVREALRGCVDIGGADGWIVPVYYRDDQLTAPLLSWFEDQGFDLGALAAPAVPSGTARLRLFVTSEHAASEIDAVAAAVIAAADRFGFRCPAGR